jgi:uncharacterized protein YecE (DUF72 family)
MGEAHGPCIRIGAAGWSYKDWVGQVHPTPQRKDFDPLGYPSRFIDAGEINSSFYRIPTPKTTQPEIGWVADAPACTYSNWQLERVMNS